jgi:hypothetical protein
MPSFTNCCRRKRDPFFPVRELSVRSAGGVCRASRCWGPAPPMLEAARTTARRVEAVPVRHDAEVFCTPAAWNDP